MTRCTECNRRCARDASRCRACDNRRMEQICAQNEDDASTVNRAIERGLVLAYGAGTLPASYGRTVRSLSYSRGAGVWSHDNARSGWCHGSVPREWLAAARAHLV